MESTPEAENPLLIVFKKINIQLEQLAERELRAEERERKAQEREQKLIERQEALHKSEVALAQDVLKFKDSVEHIEVRMKTYLSDYFKHLPKQSIVVEEQRLSIDSNTQKSLYIFLFGMIISGLLVYFASPHVDVVRLEHQSQEIESLEAKLDYMIEKNPKTAKNYEAEKEQ
jgi:hypothetical protein